MKKDMNETRKNENDFQKRKTQEKKYLVELQKFLDKADNIENEELKNDIIKQMLKCNKLLTKIEQEKINQVV